MRFQFEDCLLDTERRELRRGREAVHLEPQVFDLMVYLVDNRDRVVSRDDLVAEVWGGRAVSESALATRINAARSAIGDDGRQQRLIKTYWRKGIRFIGTVLQPDEHPRAPPADLVRARSLQKPCVAVLPFATLSDDPAQRFFVTGLVEEIADALSQFSWLSVRVLGANLHAPENVGGVVTDAHYLLDGSARMGKSGVRISARLVDAATHSRLWAHRFEGDFEDIFGLQDRLVEGVIGAIVPKLEQAEISRVENKQIETLDAYGCTLRGMGSLYQWTRVGISEALRMFRRAIEIDAEYAPAHAMAAYCYVQRQSYGWVADREQEAADSAELARQAAALAQGDALALARSAHAIASVSGDLDSGVRFIEQALLLNPYLTGARYVSGWLNIFLGKPDLAIEDLEHAMRLSPLDPLSFKVASAMAYAHLFAGRYDQASIAAEAALSARPNYLTGIRAAAAGHALAGRADKASKLMARMRQLDPKLRLSNLADLLPFSRRQDVDRWAGALSKAGLPE